VIGGRARASGDSLLRIVDSAVADAYRRGGAHLVCRPGCSQCCVGVFPIAHQDAARIRDGLTALAGTDPHRAQAVRSRVAESLARLDPWFPGDLTTGVLHEDYEAAILFEEFANDEPCPVLDRNTGTCDLYAARPVLCRTFGPPMRTEEDNLATCELCFLHASTEEIAAAALDPTLPPQEAASNADYDTSRGLHGETLIAYALRGA
jgi:Fe-S-cluster containining protein